MKFFSLFLSCLLIISKFALAENHQTMPKSAGLASIESEPSGIVDGCVNVISGQFTDYRVDLIIPGPEPIKIERMLQNNNLHPYEDPSEYIAAYWGFNYNSHLYIEKDVSYYSARLFKGFEDRSVFKLIKEKKYERIQEKGPELDRFHHGITNTSKGVIGAQANSINRKLIWAPKYEYSTLTMEDGTVLYFPGKHRCKYLEKEVLPCKLTLKYDYNKYDTLKKLSLLNKKGISLSSFEIDYHKEVAQVKVIAPDGRWVRYDHLDKRASGGNYFHILGVHSSDSPSIDYSYYPKNLNDKLKLRRKSYPNNRFKEIIYYTDGYTPEQPHFRRVHQLLAPVGDNDKALIKYQFNYHLPNGPSGAGCTGVYDALGHKTDYDYNHRQRLTSIQKYFADNTVYTKESLYWGPQDSHLGMLLRIRAFNIVNEPYDIFARRYNYDEKGNIVCDELYGHITGKTQSTLHVNEDGTISGHSDYFQKSYHYSSDNLLTESKEGSLRKLFFYDPNTKLLNACLHYDEEKKEIFLRHFYTYDENTMIIEHIVDDGSGYSVEDLSNVAERKIERIERSDKYPVGLPLVVKEYYLDPKTNVEHFYHKKINIHDNCGRLTRQETYGSDGQFAYSESWTYDAHGNIRSEINRLGQEIIRDFDANDNMTYQRGIDTRQEQRFIYDYMNRLIQIDEIHPDGTLSKHYRYDYCGNPIATIDALGNETNTEYDEFNRPIRLIGAPLVDTKGHLYRPITSYEYDALSNPIKITSPEGHITEFAYTILGKPYFIRYPDGTTEHFEYDCEGRLRRETAKNGVQTKYTYDVQGRTVKKECFASTGEFLFATEAHYNTFHLLAEVDAAGVITTYSYDNIGRKTSAVKGDVITTYHYDALGRLVKTTVRSLKDPKEGTITVTFFDRLDRVIEERQDSLKGHFLTITLFSYDAAGNKSKIEQRGYAGSDSITLMEYDTHGIPTKITDPEGNISLTRLILDHYDSHGQRVFAIEKTDPHGVISLSIQDTHGRVVETLKKDPFGNVLQKTEYQKTASGHCTTTIETVFYEKSPIRIIKNYFEYDYAGRHIGTIQAAGTPEEKRSSVQFNALGQKASSTKPNGESIIYLYDTMGRLSEYFAENGTVHYRYTYDICSNPILVENLIDGNTTHRTYDIHHRTIQETLANSLSCQMAYTPEGYLKHLTLPDTSSIQYTYDGPILKQVDRYQNQAIAYTHKYLFHDYSGKLLKSSLIHNLGLLTHQFTKKAQISQITSPFYSEDLKYDALGNLIKRTLNDPLGPQDEQFTYDLLNQLKRENSHAYTHDSLYNRCSKDGQPHTHNALNQLMSDGETEFSYDMNGNIIKEVRKNSARTFTYDALDRLKALQIDHQSWEFFYDDQNRCTSYKTQENTEHILYIGQNDIGTTDAEGNPHTLRILGKGLGAEIGAAIALEIRGKTYAPLHDHRGNITTLIDPSGKLAENYRYTSFGEEQIFDGSGMASSHSLLENPWRFSSKRHFGDYLLFGRRFYNPAQGRWLSPDPIGYQAGPNLYAYVSNNPQTHFDLYGLSENSSSGILDSVSDFIGRTCDFFSNSWDSICDSFSRGYESVREGVRSIFNAVRETTQTVGNTISFLSRHSIPFPFARDFLGGLGHLIGNGTLNGYHWSWKLDQAQRYDGEGEYQAGQPYATFNNGMNTYKIEAEAYTKLISEIMGMRFDGNYIPTAFTVSDLIEVVALNIGISRPSVSNLVQEIREKIAKSGGVNSGASIFQFAFSKGGLILDCALKQLSLEERRMVVAVTFGSAKLISSEGLKYAINYVSDKDYVSMLADPINHIKARCGMMPEVVILPCLEDCLVDHDFGSKTYLRALQIVKDKFFR